MKPCHDAFKKEANMEQKTQKHGEEFWASHIRQWESSGRSRRQYCIGEGISYWTFREWQKRLDQANLSERNLIQLPQEAYHSVEKVEPVIELSLPGNITIRISRGFDGELLRALLQELGARR